MSEWIGDVNNDDYKGEWIESTSKEFREDELITITKEELNNLIERSEFLECLEACGVDNWQGYDDAWEMMNEED